MKAYLDNGATTVVSKEIVEKMNQLYTDMYGNPSSMHQMGVETEKLIKEVKRTLAKGIKASPDEIIFTSGGTEANNLAIQGYLRTTRKKHLITSMIEHPSVLNVFEFYENQGYEVTYLKVDEKGHISLEELRESLREDTALVSIMYVNNELGSIQDLQAVSRLIKKHSKAVFHVDAVQALGKVECHVKKHGIDMMTMSSHKIHGPMGVGALYIKKDISIKPLFIGGGQQKAIRPGTENAPGVVGFGEALKAAFDGLAGNQAQMIELRDYFIKCVLEIPQAKLNGKCDAPHIINVSFPNMRGEVLLHTLESKNIYVSTGSACASKNKSYSHVLEAIGLDDKHKEGAIRFSLSKYTTKDELDYAIKNLKESILELDSIIKGR
ncbi:cysteine desulfurase [Acidaminobacter sp. JC074]|uniref:cysteine desulfurase family protein n=1 Tax=Acidaminobacter sp. JC074 TaxID=2530199 RepID=UPI001F10E849|nr:cysteine desulfurase family protein [Acidaminobacter sp. JC074]MCH4889425.1 cysteine desulfurase [Acidaminobacter sp. JC074]